ncbi:hypothetical protein [Acidipila sp. EB88]|uniref:hypothetical protein n=1 Tax=Acidipila sp. EB88 TaxID=2305226 RepID=UPI000F5E279D|nr:hypothetical protein [Acidipila sp. EB88]
MPLALLALTTATAVAQTQTTPGAGNAQAVLTANNAPLVQSAYHFLQAQIGRLSDDNLRTQTYDAIVNPDTCVLHRANLKPADRQAIVATLLAQGLLNKADDATFPGGLIAGVFPPVLNDNSACPHLPQPFYSAPGSSFGSHHSYPGGLPVHESNNETADINLASEYHSVYGQYDANGLDFVNADTIAHPTPQNVAALAPYLSPDLIVGAPLWHDWAKSIVFQWNADGTEFQELSIGGAGASMDDYGQAGDARTGGHHILSIAEAMKRGLSPAFLITQASAHSAPTSGNEFKVVNWIRAAAIIAQQDPLAKGYLIKDGSGNYRLPALEQTGEVDLVAAGQTNILTEYELHNLSDSDFTFSGPSVAAVQLVLAQVAGSFGYNAADTATYNNKFRNVVLANFSAERLYAVYSANGLDGVRIEVQMLRSKGSL